MDQADVTRGHHRGRDWNWAFDRFVFFTWWVALQRRVQELPKTTRYWLVGGSIGLGAAARLWAQTLPGNWDFGQWVNVSTAVLEGNDPYALFGYNYPPPWLMVLTGFNAITSSDQAFRLFIAILLIAADIGIALLLARRGYTLAACLLMLSPVTIAISGQHQQVEGIALFLALAAVTIFGESRSERISARDWIGVLLLGLSLAFKPIFLLLPVWLLVRRGPWRKRLIQFVGPLVVFVVVFSTAFLAYPVREVLQKVLGHGGANNSPLINEFVPQQLAPWIIEHGGGKVAFVVLLIGAAWLFRQLEPFESALAYSISAVLFSWAVVNQYLSTPMGAVFVYLNVGLLIWFLLSAVYLGGGEGVLNLPGLNIIQPHVLLDWEKVMQDLFPWLLIGWIVYAFATRRRGAMMTPTSRAQEVTR